MDQWKTTIISFLTLYGFQVVGALIILAVGWVVARWLGNLTMGWLNKQDLEPPFRTLIVRTVRLLVLAFTLVVVLDKFGVPVTRSSRASVSRASASVWRCRACWATSWRG